MNKSYNVDYVDSNRAEDITDEFKLAKKVFCALLILRDQVKLKHFFPENWSNHLLFDEIVKKLDDCIDNVGEKYFLAQKIDLRNLLIEERDFILTLMSEDSVVDSMQSISSVLDLIENVEMLYKILKYECFKSIFSDLLGDLLQIKGWLDVANNR